jgi:hypothetical protein
MESEWNHQVITEGNVEMKVGVQPQLSKGAASRRDLAGITQDGTFVAFYIQFYQTQASKPVLYEIVVKPHRFDCYALAPRPRSALAPRSPKTARFSRDEPTTLDAT